jgi:hypothetical protein
VSRLHNLLREYDTLYWTDKILAIVIGSVLILLAMAAFSALVVVLLRLKNSRVAQRWNRLEALWEERLLDVLAGDLACDELRARVDPNDEARFVDFLHRFARQLRGAERETLAALAARYLPSVADQVQSPNAERRARAILVLSTLGGASYEDVLLRALDDESSLVSMVAARALASAEFVHHARRILERIDRFERWSPRHLAAMFAAIGQDAAQPLRVTLADPAATDRARVVAAESLLLLRDFESAGAARAIIAGWASPEVLIAALRLLAAVGSDADAPEVRRVARSAHSAVRSAAIATLGMLGDASDIPLIERTLSDESPWVALNAASAMREVGASDRLEEIVMMDLPGAHAARELLERPRS